LFEAVSVRFCVHAAGSMGSHGTAHVPWVPHHAINLGTNAYGRNFVEYNRIHHVCLETVDNGAINLWMDVPRE